ncbi:hypothetical protein [Micromonospora sp. NPDC048830]|uniref:hypothetical protein n=1 Tax=Micromonospora sp. NPDC048830 TaxID=3364257 RepID=UPI003723742A
MTTHATNAAADQRMTPDDYVVTTVAGDFADDGRLAFHAFLAGYYAESIRLIHRAHLTDCTVAAGDNCPTCNAIRGGLVGLLAEQRTDTTTGREVSGRDPR